MRDRDGAFATQEWLNATRFIPSLFAIRYSPFA